MPERSVGSANYRYAFNGMEVDNEVSGNGNSYDFGARMYNPRLGRWFSPDYLKEKHPDKSPYAYATNSPILFMDPDGNDYVITIIENKSGNNQMIISTTSHVYGKNAERIVKNFNLRNPTGTYTQSGTYIDDKGKSWDITINISMIVDHSLDNLGNNLTDDGDYTREHQEAFEDRLNQLSPDFPGGDNVVNSEYKIPIGFLELADPGGKWTGAQDWKSALHGIFHNIGADDHRDWDNDLSESSPTDYPEIRADHFKMIGKYWLEDQLDGPNYQRRIDPYIAKSNSGSFATSEFWSVTQYRFGMDAIFNQQNERQMEKFPDVWDHRDGSDGQTIPEDVG